MHHPNFTRINLIAEPGIEFRRIPLIDRSSMPQIGDDLAKLGDGSIYVAECVSRISALTKSAKAINGSDTFTIWLIRTTGFDENELYYHEQYFIATKNDE